MMMKLLMTLRRVTYSGFGTCEHICAFGYALGEFKVRFAETLLFFASIGLVATITIVVIDLTIRHCKVLKIRRRERNRLLS
jgi:hypothetical protein